MQANELFDRPNTILLDGGMGTMLHEATCRKSSRSIHAKGMVNSPVSRRPDSLRSSCQSATGRR